MKKIKNNSTIPNDSILVTADVVRLYSSILHEAGFKALEKALNNHCVKSIQIRSYFWSVFSCIRTEYGDLLRKSLYSVRI